MGSADETAGTRLQETLVELTDLTIQAKQAHWNVTGRMFVPVHEQLEVLANDVRAASDEVAERAVTVGHPVDARLSTIAKETPLQEFPTGAVSDTEAVRVIAERLREIADRTRQRMGQLTTADEVSHDVLLSTAKMLEKHRWMFRTQLR